MATRISHDPKNGRHYKSITIDGRKKKAWLTKDHAESLELWLKHEDDFRQGLSLTEIQNKRSRDKSPTLEVAFTRYLDQQKARYERKQKDPNDPTGIGERQWTDVKATCKRMVAFLGKSKRVDSLGPTDFTAYANKLSETRNPMSRSSEINRCRGVFNWLCEERVIERLPRYGTEFRVLTKSERRAYKKGQPDKLFEPQQIHDIFAELGVAMRAMAYLGINAGFLPKECYLLTMGSLAAIDQGWLCTSRNKTAVDRKAKLWPETIEALKLWLRYRPESAKQNVFLKHDGSEWVAGNGDATRRFTTALRQTDNYVEGVSFSALRTTFNTIARETGDDAAVKVVMGHVDDSVQNEHYTERFPEKRIIKVANHVRSWLFDDQSK